MKEMQHPIIVVALWIIRSKLKMKTKILLTLCIFLSIAVFANDEAKEIREQLAKELHCEATPEAIKKELLKSMDNGSVTWGQSVQNRNIVGGKK